MLAAQVIMRDQPSVAEPSVRAMFESLGFALGPTFAGSFSISAPVETFERVFGVALAPLPDTLPLERLGVPAAEAVSAVVFTTGYGPFP